MFWYKLQNYDVSRQKVEKIFFGHFFCQTRQKKAENYKKYGLCGRISIFLKNHEKLFNSMKNGHNELKFGHKVNLWGLLVAASFLSLVSYWWNTPVMRKIPCRP